MAFWKPLKTLDNVKLTRTTKKSGCAAKIAATTLREVLSTIDLPTDDPNLILDNKTFDDAGVYKINDELALVETLDFFTPIVDNPYSFGRIAAVNALSDVYAMGGRPKTCMAILAFPLAVLEESIMAAVLKGAGDVIREAKAVLVGGHSIDDDSLKFGLSVTGHVHPEKLWTNAGAKAGDDLILTKPLGTGCMTASVKAKVSEESDIEDAIQSMGTLNNIIDHLDDNLVSKIHGGTDVTGFALMGHSMQMAQASQVSMEFDYKQLPFFSRALEFTKAKCLTKAHFTNRTYTENHIELSQSLDKDEQNLLFDPQTSGGLLLSVDPEFTDQILSKIKEAFPAATKVGRVITEKDKRIYVS